VLSGIFEKGLFLLMSLVFTYMCSVQHTRSAAVALSQRLTISRVEHT
jgi:hypothetical protein